VHRFHTAAALIAGEHILAGQEAHHLATVLRAAEGVVVELFDGHGTFCTATVKSVTKNQVITHVNMVQREPPPTRRLTLATAVPKGERCDWLVEKATELGVTRWVPLITERSSVDPRDSKLDRLRHLVISACKQSGRNWLMEISPVTTWADCVRSTTQDHAFLIAAPDGQPWVNVMPCAKECVIAIGPEGGWTPAEIDVAVSHGAKIVSLGGNILRIETAAIVIAALFSAGDPGMAIPGLP